MKTCDICGRTEAEAQLESWDSNGVTFTVCVDNEACRDHFLSPEPPPVDQLLRQRGFAELPGMEAS